MKSLSVTGRNGDRTGPIGSRMLPPIFAGKPALIPLDAEFVMFVAKCLPRNRPEIIQIYPFYRRRHNFRNANATIRPDFS